MHSTTEEEVDKSGCAIAEEDNQDEIMESERCDCNVDTPSPETEVVAE